MDDAEAPPAQLPPLPEPWQFPPKLLERWATSPPEMELTFSVTKQMVDHLFFALNQLSMAQSHMDVALVAYSNNDLDTANTRLIQGRESTVSSLSHARQMLTGFMRATLGDQGD